MRKTFATLVCFTIGILFAVQLAAQEASPRREFDAKPAHNSNGEIAPAGTVKVLLVKSWGAASIWQDMSTNWQNFGKRRVTVDYTTYVNSDFTYQDLVN